MNERLRQLSINSWPIWFKLLVGFGIAILIPLVLMAALIMGGIQDVGRQSVELYVAETGVRQWESINTAFINAQAALADFADDADHTELLARLLPASAAVPVEAVNKGAMIDIMQQALLNRPDSPFQRIDLLDSRGRLVVQALPGRGRELSPSEDRSGSNAYQVALNADLLGMDQDLALSVEGDQPVIELIQIIDAGQDQPGGVRQTLGYLVATINARHVIIDNLRLGDFFDTRSYLISPAGLLITAENSQLIAPSQAQLLLSGEEYLSDFNEVMRYSQPIIGTPLLLINEGRADAVAGDIFRYVSTRGFVLVAGLLGLVAVLVVAANYLLTPPLRRLREAILAAGRGNFEAAVPDVHRGDEIGALAGSFADMRQRVQALISDLEARIEARTRDIAATQEISHFAATQRDLQKLLDQVVNLITERFANIYHAQIFLVDAEAHYAVLRASTGIPGQRLLEKGHRLEVGGVSVVGQASGLGQYTIARDTGESTIHRRNEELPDTRAELAIPLRVSDNRVIGVLDVQSRQVDTFTEDQITVLQTMADQIAIAIENARLYQESLRRLEEIERSRGAATLQAWREYMKQERTRIKRSEAGLRPAQAPSPALRQAAIEQGRPVVGQLTDRQTIPIAVPIRLRNQVLGVVQWELPQESFDLGKLQLAEELTTRLALSLDNARLFQESQRATDRERLVNEIAARLTTQTDVDQILQTAVREVGQALRAPQVRIRLNHPSGNGHDDNGHHGNGHTTQATSLGKDNGE